MKKQLTLLLGLFGLTAIAFSAVGPNYHSTRAGSKEILIVDDNFNDGNYRQSYDPSKWLEPIGGHIRQSDSNESYLTNKGAAATNGERLMFGTKQMVQGLSLFKIDVCLRNDEWVGIKFYKELQTPSSMAQNAYDMSILFHKSGITPNNSVSTGQQLFRHDGTEAPSGGIGLLEVCGISSSIGNWVTLDFVPIDANNMTLYVYPQAEGRNADRSVTIKCSEDGLMNYGNCQIGIQASNGARYSIDNLVIESTNINVNEEFVSFDDSLPENPLGYVKKNGGSYVLDGNSTLRFAPEAMEGEKFVTKKKIALDMTIAAAVEMINAKFNLKFKSTAASSEKIAFFVGLSNASYDLSQGGCYLEFNKTKVELKLFKNGVLINSEEEQRIQKAIDGLTSSEGRNITVSVQKNGILRIYVEDELLYSLEDNENEEMRVSKYAGYVGFAVTGGLAQEVNVDNVLIKSASYYVPVTKSVTHNFSNDFFGNEGHEDFYIPDSYAGKISVKDGKLDWDNCADNAMFGSAYQYDAFILDYKLCNVRVGEGYTAPNKWIGLDLSRESKYVTEYGSYLMPYIEIVPTTEEVRMNFYKKDSSPLDANELVKNMIVEHKRIPAKWFRDIQYTNASDVYNIKEENAVCIRWVSDGTNLDLYLKRADDPVFGEPYYTIKNLEIQGYFTLTVTGWTTLQYDDFSMANTSTLYVCADNESPETIIDTQITIIYEPGTDINLGEEVRLYSNNTLWIILVAALGTTTVAFAALFIVNLVRNKKMKGGAKNE